MIISKLNIYIGEIKKERVVKMNNDKTLIVYYSYTGNTKMIAESIQNKLNCKILELKPIKPYSKDYDTVVAEEQNNNGNDKTVEIEKIDINLNDYDKIIIGTPVWWYGITPVIRTFLKETDLTGKTIIPFATNAGWLGHTFKDIEKLCPNSTVKTGKNISFTENYKEKQLVTSPDDVDRWISSL